VVSDWPALFEDPLAGAQGGDGAVGVARVMHQSVLLSVLKKRSVYPNGTLSLNVISLIHIIVAIEELLNILRNIQRLPDLRKIDV
jgi:hypothetical protein